MAHSSSSSAEDLPTRFRNVVARTRYQTIVAAKNKWEEQGFFLDDHMENYGSEPLIYKRLSDLGWLHFGRQAAQANLSWVREFYAHNPKGNDAAYARGKRVPANSATINTLLDLPEDLPSIYALIDALEDEDLNLIIDQLCLPNTTRNITGKTQVQSTDPIFCPRPSYGTCFRFNIDEVITRELSDAFQNDKGILAFPCIISALCRRAAVPSRPSEKYTRPKTG
ncbi:hypothetical protein V6N13_024801 [Hibiscus sabdariffa]|uniref:Uncharacterized protein n=1 Tax=Hibiscus sabdariffa TaxID=183260 RepID=A0ABR2QGB2_9ROSI